MYSCSHNQYMHVRTYRAYKLVQMRMYARVNVHNTWYYCTSAVRRDCASVCLATTVNFVGILSIFERIYCVYRPTLNDWPIREVKHWLCRWCSYIQSFLSSSFRFFSHDVVSWRHVRKWLSQWLCHNNYNIKYLEAVKDKIILFLNVYENSVRSLS